MNTKDRVYKVLNHETPDYCPVLIRAMAQNIQYEYADKFEIKEEDECFYWRDLTPLISMKVDAFDYNLPTQKPHVKLKDGRTVGPMGRVFQNGAYSDGFFKTREIFNKWQDDHPYKLVDENDPQNFKKMVDLAGDRIAIFANLRGYFETTWESIGLGTFAKYQRKDPSFIKEVIDAIENYTYNNLKLLLEQDVEFISIADDLGFKNGPVTNENFYHENIFPRYKKICNAVHKIGGKIYLHSEGNITTLMKGIIEAGFDGVQGLTPIDGIDLKSLKETWGDKIALLGCLSHSPLLDKDTHNTIKKKIKGVFDKAGENGGLMIGPSAMIDKYCTIDRVITMIQTIHNFKY